MCACVRQTLQGTTRVDILFERKHNKTRWNMVQEEQGVILKVNKQKKKRPVVEALFLLFMAAEEGAGPAKKRLIWGFPTRMALMVFHRQCFLTSAFRYE